MDSKLAYIEIQKDIIPYYFDITLGIKTYRFYIRYNVEHDFFTVDLFDGSEAVVLGEKIVYGRELFSTTRYAKVPDLHIMPYDLSENESQVTWQNFNQSVFLWVVNNDALEQAD